MLGRTYATPTEFYLETVQLESGHYSTLTVRVLPSFQGR